MLLHGRDDSAQFTYHKSAVFFYKFVDENFGNLFFEDSDLKDAYLANGPKTFLKMFLFYYKIGL